MEDSRSWVSHAEDPNYLGRQQTVTDSTRCIWPVANDLSVTRNMWHYLSKVKKSRPTRNIWVVCTILLFESFVWCSPSNSATTNLAESSSARQQPVLSSSMLAYFDRSSRSNKVIPGWQWTGVQQQLQSDSESGGDSIRLGIWSRSCSMKTWNLV